MKVLLDTHVFVWWITNHPQLSRKARKILENGKNRLFLSIASVWEMAIKASGGKLIFSEPFETFLPQQLAENAIEVLPVQLNHVLKVFSLPFHHRDPFDRLLAAQSLVEECPLLSQDPHLQKYGVKLIW